MTVNESMQYPLDFPPESRARVTAERLRAGKDFDEARENAPHREYGGTRQLEAELRRYILRQFAVFTSEACKLGCQGIWPVERVEKAALEFLRRCTIEATSSKGCDRLGRTFGRDWIGNWGGGIEPTAMRELERLIDEAHGFSGDLIRNADWTGIKSGKSFDEKYRRISERKPRSLKGEAWGRALARYARENPMRKDNGRKRPLISDIEIALRARTSDYDIHAEHGEIDPITFKFSWRTHAS